MCALLLHQISLNSSVIYITEVCILKLFFWFRCSYSASCRPLNFLILVSQCGVCLLCSKFPCLCVQVNCFWWYLLFWCSSRYEFFTRSSLEWIVVNYLHNFEWTSKSATRLPKHRYIVDARKVAFRLLYCSIFAYSCYKLWLLTRSQLECLLYIQTCMCEVFWNRIFGSTTVFLQVIEWELRLLILQFSCEQIHFRWSPRIWFATLCGGLELLLLYYVCLCNFSLNFGVHFQLLC